MDNIENYFYILFAVIYIISRVIKARNKHARSKQQQPQRPVSTNRPSPAVQPQSQQHPKKSFSFEDILKEFEKNLAGEEEEYEKPLPVNEIKHEKPAPVPVQQVAKKSSPYDEYKGTGYKTIKEEIEQDEKAGFKRSENYSIKENIGNQYVKMLQDPDGFKNAIVLSEIINRKYF